MARAAASADSQTQCTDQLVSRRLQEFLVMMKSVVRPQTDADTQMWYATIKPLITSIFGGAPARIGRRGAAAHAYMSLCGRCC